MKSRARVAFRGFHTAFEGRMHPHVWEVTVERECLDHKRPVDGRELQAALSLVVKPLAAEGLERTLGELATNEGVARWVGERLLAAGVVATVDVWREADGLGASWP